MAETKSEEPRMPGRVASGRMVRVALGFVILSLAALVLVPVLVQRRIEALRLEVDTGAEPARTLVTQVQFSLAHQMSALRGYVITGSSHFVQSFAGASRREEAAYRELEPLVAALGPRTAAEFAELRTLSAQWHARLREEELVRGTGEREEFLPRIIGEQELYTQVLQAASDLYDAIVAEALTRRHRIRTEERRGAVLGSLLGVLALAAALAVAGLGRRIESLHAEAERRRRDAELALEEMRRTEAARDRLLRGVTHDIKNPLGAADGYAELLEMGLRGELAPEQGRIVAGIRRSIRGALAIIQDLLDLARAEHGSLPVRRIRVDLAALVREAAEDHRGAVEGAGLALEVDASAARIEVHTDPDRVRQVLGNLLSNAVKYTPAPGHVRVAARESAAGDGSWAEVRVEDTGPGIPPEEREQVFLEFHRLHTGPVRGHGLGLAISRRIAGLLGGTLVLESEVGRGSAFTLRIPVRGDDREGAPAGPERGAALRTSR
jgi:signal transduction histidine kinase